MTIATASSQNDPTAPDAGLVVPIQRLTHAEPAAIERLYADHYRDVFRYALGLTRSIVEAEDISADTFERAVRTWKELPAQPVAWLLLTARHIATDRWRRAGRLARILLTTRATDRELSRSDSEFLTWFHALASVLTPRQREVLILRYQRDLTDADIGGVMGLSESGVRSLVARALAVLRSHPELLA